MSRSENRSDKLHSAAIVCAHVASGRSPILLAERTEPEEAADSGWQFLCGLEDEEWDKAQVWSVQEVIDTDASLAKLVDLPVGTRLARAASTENWENVPAPQHRV